MEAISGFHEYAYEYLDSRYYEEAYLREDIMFRPVAGLYRYDLTYDEPSLPEDNMHRDRCVALVQATRPSAVGAVCLPHPELPTLVSGCFECVAVLHSMTA